MVIGFAVVAAIAILLENLLFTMGYMMAKEVVLRKNGNFLLVDPLIPDDKIEAILSPKLSFDSYRQLVGKELYEAKRSGQKPFAIDHHTLFELDHKGRIATPFGFWKTISKTLKAAGYKVSFVDTTTVKKPDRFKLYMQNIKDYTLREHQPEFLQAVINNSCGRIDCAPGFGKSFMIGIIASVFPKARIDIVSRRVPVLCDRIYNELTSMVGDVGIVGGGHKVKNRRVMCYTAGSLKHSPADADILIGDECHELAADNASEELIRWQNSRNYGLSASHDARFDGKDLRLEGIFGPIIYRVDYQTSQGAGLVVPIEVHWTNVKLDYNPCAGIDTDEKVKRKRAGLWKNDGRNALIAQDARSYDKDTQVLITVDTIIHAFHLKKLLPEFTLVYADNGLEPQELQAYKQQGFCSSEEPLMDFTRKKMLTQQFEKGQLKKVIATTVWNVGVSFNNLAVLIRGNGGSSEIDSTQIPGRVSRIAEGKASGVIHDYLDGWDSGFNRHTKGRMKVYRKHGWRQKFQNPQLEKEYE
jgi:superfamily II DNA or RNA helicase